MENKNSIDPRFYISTNTIRNNPTFRTYVDHQYKDLEERTTFMK